MPEEAKKPDPCVMELPVTGDKENPVAKIFQSSVDEWQTLYPGVDVMQQLRNMRGWLEANPTRRKTKRGIKRFIVNWLGKEQNRSGPSRASPAQPRTFAEQEEERFQKLLEQAAKRDAARDRGQVV